MAVAFLAGFSLPFPDDGTNLVATPVSENPLHTAARGDAATSLPPLGARAAISLLKASARRKLPQVSTNGWCCVPRDVGCPVAHRCWSRRPCLPWGTGMNLALA